MEAPRFDTEDLISASVEVVEEYRHESDTEDRTAREQQIAEKALNQFLETTDEDTDSRLNALH